MSETDKRYKFTQTAATIQKLLNNVETPDKTLTLSGEVADAKAVGDKIRELSKEKIDKNSIEHTTGDAEDKVMSQKSITEKFESYGITVVDGYLCMEL